MTVGRDFGHYALVIAESAVCHAHKGDYERAIALADEALRGLRERAPKGIWA